MQIYTNRRQLIPRRSRRRRLPFPAAPNLRMAQLSAPSLFDSVEAFPRERWNALESFRPRILVGSTADLQSFAEWVRRTVADLSSVDHAIFALTRMGDEPLTDVTRVVLWQAFGVPVYELFLGNGGVMLAAECEAHEGWHVEPNVRFFVGAHGELAYDAPSARGQRTGLRGSVRTETCSCGREGARLLDVEGFGFDSLLQLAATA